MRLSYESRELISTQHTIATQEVFRRSRAELQRLEQLARSSGPPRSAIDEKYAEIATEVLDAKIASYLAGFRREHLIPTDDDIREICSDLNEEARRIWFSHGHSPMPSSMDLYTMIAPRAELRLKVAVKEMSIEAKHAVREAATHRQVAPPMSERTASAEPAASEITIADVDALELRPNIFGVGINLNHIIKRIAAWRRRREK